MISFGPGYTKKGHKPPKWIWVLLIAFVLALAGLLLAR